MKWNEMKWNEMTANTHTQFWMNVYGTMAPGFAYLEVAMQKLAPNHET